MAEQLSFRSGTIAQQVQQADGRVEIVVVQVNIVPVSSEDDMGIVARTALGSVNQYDVTMGKHEVAGTLRRAREHDLPSWTALKQLICGQSQQECHALPQLRWVIARFRDAGEPAWAAPGDHELRQHFDDHFLTTRVIQKIINRELIKL
ncbi:MAG TPA: hypothetical protein VMV92_27305 [Streptosporangiaceae bacterium]|nr:hypothetical protein [Streptosporangiaceae bacterium]